MECESLSKYLERKMPRSKSILSDIVCGLQYLHNCKLPRDLTSGDVLLTYGPYVLAEIVTLKFLNHEALITLTNVFDNGILLDNHKYETLSTDRADIFSFGTIVLNLLPGVPEIDYSRCKTEIKCLKKQKSRESKENCSPIFTADNVHLGLPHNGM
jgi:serine/threonine protein kinase